MIYAGDLAIAYPVKDIYDTNIMRMSIEAAKDMYEKGLQQIKDFYKEYGDFISPILKDMDWYALNVTGRVRDTINDLYANGIDPLRSALGRAAISLLIYSMPTGDIAKLRLSAENATIFNKAKADLLLKGLYNSQLSPYEGIDMSKYSTLGDNNTPASGIWDRMSPTPYHDLATFGNPYFEGMKPNVHKRSKNGISYSEESITMNDLKAIADSKFNELVSTPQGQLMFKYYKDVTGNDDAARNMFNEAIANAQQRRTYVKDDYNDQYFQHANLALQREKFNWEKQKEAQELELKRQKQAADLGGEGTQLNGFSLAQRWFDRAQANAWSADGMTKDWWDMLNSYDQFGKDVDSVFRNFGKKLANSTKGKFDKELYAADSRSAYWKATEEQRLNESYLPDKNNPKYYSANKWANRIRAYEKQFSFDMDTKSVAGAIGDTIAGNDRVVQATDANIDRLFGVNDIISGTAGFTAQYRSADTNAIRGAIKLYGSRNTTITPLGVGYGSLRKKTGAFEVMPKVKVVVKDDDGNIKFEKTAYYDIGLSTATTSGGAYISGYKENHIGGFGVAGNPGSHYDSDLNVFMPNDVLFYDTGNPIINTAARTYNMYPDYNRWTSFGGWDTRESSKLHAGQSVKLRTY